MTNLASNQNVIILLFVAMIFLSMVLSTAGGKSKILSFATLISAVVMFITGMFYSPSTINLLDSFYYDKYDIRLVIFLGLINILIIFFNTIKSIKHLRSSIVSCLMFLTSFFCIGSQEMSTLFITIEFLFVLYSLEMLYSANLDARKHLTKGVLINSVFAALFFVGLACFYLSTGTISFTKYIIHSSILYNFSIGIFIIVAIYKIGLMPFHFLTRMTFNLSSRGNILSSLFLYHLTVSYVFILLIQSLFYESELSFQIYIIKVIIIISVVCGFISALVIFKQKNKKNVFSFSFIGNMSLLFLIIILNPEEDLRKHVIYYLLYNSAVFSGVLIIINKFRLFKDGPDYSISSAKRYFSDNGHIGVIFIISMFSLSMIPYTGGFISKYIIIKSLLVDSYIYTSVLSFIIIIINSLAHMRLAGVVFDCISSIKSSKNINFIGTVICYGFALYIIVVGIAPQIILK